MLLLPHLPSGLLTVSHRRETEIVVSVLILFCKVCEHGGDEAEVRVSFAEIDVDAPPKWIHLLIASAEDI